MQKGAGSREASERDRNKNGARSQRRWEELKNIDGTSRIIIPTGIGELGTIISV